MKNKKYCVAVYVHRVPGGGLKYESMVVLDAGSNKKCNLVTLDAPSAGEAEIRAVDMVKQLVSLGDKIETTGEKKTMDEKLTKEQQEIVALRRALQILFEYLLGLPEEVQDSIPAIEGISVGEVCALCYPDVPKDWA